MAHSEVYVKRDDLAHDVRAQLQRLPEPYASHYGVVPLPPPEDVISLSDARSTHQRAIEMIARVDTLAAEIKDRYLISRILNRQEAVSSSSIEGTNSTLDELLTIEEDDENARAATRQVRDYALTLERLVPLAQSQGHSIFTAGLISELHAEAMRSDPDYADVPGETRKTVVWIGGGGNIAYSTFNPPPPDRIQESLAANINYMRCEGMQAMTQSLITRMALAHAHFEAVHPFRDGNGRVGRLLLPLMMAAEGHTPLYLSPYIEVHKQAYYAALKEAQRQLNWQPLIGFLSEAITRTVEELFATRNALRTLTAQWRERRNYRAKSAALRTLDLLPDYPVITAKRLAKLLSISIPSTIQGIQQLQEVGILTERTGYKRNRIFAAAEVLSIINRPFGSEPDLSVV